MNESWHAGRFQTGGTTALSKREAPEDESESGSQVNL